jgi:hypothetical protein
MPIIVFGTKKGKLSLYDPDRNSATGRWTYALGREIPAEPDRCDHCFNSKTLAHYPAQGYRTIKTRDVRNGKLVHVTERRGICHRCHNLKPGFGIFWYEPVCQHCKFAGDLAPGHKQSASGNIKHFCPKCGNYLGLGRRAKCSRCNEELREATSKMIERCKGR